MPSPKYLTNTYADWIEQIEQAVYAACGPNVGPEEFDELAERVCEALNGLKFLNCTASERGSRALKTAEAVFGSYIRR
jgi:hypothetical protein